MAELAAVLALQVLGGDPEAAYLTAICGVGYALVLAVGTRDGPSRFLTWQRSLGAVSLWFVAAVGLAYAGPAPLGIPRRVGASSPPGWSSAWHGVALAPPAWRGTAGAEAGRLMGACPLAMALAAVQVLPPLEFAAPEPAGVRDRRSTSTVQPGSDAGSPN